MEHMRTRKHTTDTLSGGNYSPAGTPRPIPCAVDGVVAGTVPSVALPGVFAPVE